MLEKEFYRHEDVYGVDSEEDKTVFAFESVPVPHHPEHGNDYDEHEREREVDHS